MLWLAKTREKNTGSSRYLKVVKSKPLALTTLVIRDPILYTNLSLSDIWNTERAWNNKHIWWNIKFLFSSHGLYFICSYVLVSTDGIQMLLLITKNPKKVQIVNRDPNTLGNSNIICGQVPYITYFSHIRDSYMKCSVVVKMRWPCWLVHV